MASLRQATRLAGKCPDPQQIGRESLDVEEWGGAGAATEWRRHGVEAGGNPALLRNNDGVRWAVSWHARRTPRAKETGLTRRLGDDERTEGSAGGACS